MPSVVALIPAREGSTRVPGKNVRPLAGHPLIAYSIAAAREAGVFDAVVVSTDGVVGIVSERDVVRKLHERGGDLLRLPVSEIMTTMVATCTPADTVDHLSALMTNKRVRHIPVVENNRLVGIVSIGDIVKQRMQELESEQRALQDYITRG